MGRFKLSQIKIVVIKRGLIDSPLFLCYNGNYDEKWSYQLNKIEQINVYQRHQFDPSSKGDMIEVRKFLHNNKWEYGCPFILEWPFLDIPSMIKDKITQYTLKGLK